MRPGQIDKQRVVSLPERYSREEFEQLVERSLNASREFRVGYIWQDDGRLRIYFAPHEQYAEQLTEEFIDEQIECLAFLGGY